MRHGEPEVPEFADRINAKAFRQCLDVYNRCGILESSRPASDTLSFFRDFSSVVASDRLRSIESAYVLSGSDEVLLIDPLFREIDDTFISLPLLKLKPQLWAKIFILLWYFGGFEFKKAFREGKARARECARKLADLAEAHGKVLFVGHGFINSYIASELRNTGWQGPKLPGKKYWEYAVYRLEEPRPVISQ